MDKQIAMELPVLGPSVFVVEGKAQLIAAVQCSSHETEEQAATNPVAIRLGRTLYTFPDGLTDTRAKQIIRKIKATTAKAFAL